MLLPLLETFGFLSSDFLFGAPDTRYFLLFRFGSHRSDFWSREHRGTNQDDQFVSILFVRRTAKQITQQRNVLKEGDARIAFGFRGLDQTSEDNCIMVAH